MVSLIQDPQTINYMNNAAVSKRMRKLLRAIEDIETRLRLSHIPSARLRIAI